MAIGTGSRSKLGALVGPKPGTFKPGQSGNPGGRPKVPELRLRGLLGTHLNETILDEIPDQEGNQHVVEISRMEALVRLMVRTVFEPDPDYPAFRAECLKQILARIDPVKKDDGNGAGAQIIIMVRDESGMAFAETLQQQAQRLPALEAPHVIEALRTVDPNLDFNGVSNGNGDDSPEAGDGPTSEYGCAT